MWGGCFADHCILPSLQLAALQCQGQVLSRSPLLAPTYAQGACQRVGLPGLSASKWDGDWATFEIPLGAFAWQQDWGGRAFGGCGGGVSDWDVNQVRG